MGVVPNHNSIQMLKKLVPLNLLSEEDLEQLLQNANFVKEKAGTYLFRQGDTDYHNVYLLSGQVALLDKMREVDRVAAGSETARFPLAHQIPRKNSVRAIGRVDYVLIDNRKLSELLVKSSDDDYKVTDLNTVVTDDWMAQLLQSKVFQQIPAANIQGVIMRMEEVVAKPGQNVIEQGGEGDYFYLIHQGQCTVLRKAEGEDEPTELAKLGPGDSFGEEALLSDSPRNSTVRMLTKGTLLRLSKKDFIEFVKRPLARGVRYEEAASMVKDGAVWLDVRPPEEYATGHINNSVSLPLNTLRYQASNLAADQNYVIYCGDGQLSATAAFLLTDRGYQVSVLEGGLRSVSQDVLVQEGEKGEETSAKVINLHSGEEIADDAGLAVDHKQLEELKSKLDAANTKIRDLGVRYHGFKEKQQKEAAQREAELKAQKVILETTRDRLDELRGKKKADQESLELLEQEKAELNASLEAAQEKLNSAGASTTDLESRYKAEQESGRELLRERDELQARLEQQQQEQQQQLQKEKERQELETSRLQETEQRLAGLEQEYKDKVSGLEQELESSRGRQEQAAEAKAGLEKEVEQLRLGQSGIEQQHDSATSALKQQLEQISSELEQSREQHQAAQGELEQLQSSLQESESGRHESQQASRESQAELEKLRQGQTQAEGELQELRDSYQQTQSELTRLQETHEQTLSELKGLQENRQSSAADMGELEDASRQAARELQQLQETHEQTLSELKELQENKQNSAADMDELEELKASYRQSESELQQERTLRQSAEAELEQKAAAATTDGQDEVKVLKSELSSLTEALEEADIAYDQIRERAELLAEEKEQTTKLMAELESNSSSAREELGSLAAELEQLRSAPGQDETAGQDEIRREADALREELKMVQQHSGAEIEELQSELQTARSQLGELETARGSEKADEESRRQELDQLREASGKWEQRVGETETKCRSLEDAIEDRDGKIDLITLELDEVRLKLAEAESARLQQEERLNLMSHEVLQDEDEDGDTFMDSRLAGRSRATVHMEDYQPEAAPKGPMLLWFALGAVLSFILLDGVMVVAGKGELITGLFQEEAPVAVKPPVTDVAATKPKPKPAPTAAPAATSAAPPLVEPDILVESSRPQPTWSVLTDLEFGPEMIKLKGGSYTMGSNRNQVSGNESPAHKVKLNSFAISRYEVTFNDYDRFAQATGRKLPSDEGWGRGKRPVINVSWDDAMSYALWLSEQTGKIYRLPTEAEWEFSVRGGSDSTYWWGYQMEDARANCFDCGSQWDQKSTAPIGSFGSNNFGLHDMAGNVREWVLDCYHPNYKRAPVEGTAWMESGCSVRVVRGGAFNKTSDSMRSTWRGHFKQDSRLSFTGFRVVRELR
jgi:formylglycine-generating enzyme required for sulfatase activity/rhodanese-related sulfurtransferase